MGAAVDAKDIFTLNVLGPALAEFQPPTGAFDPAGDWTHRYGVWTVGQRGCARVGHVGLARSVGKDGTAVLRLEYVKTYSGAFQGRTMASIQCRADRLATPLSWTASVESLTPKGARVPNTAIQTTGRVAGKALALTSGKARRTLPLPEAYTINWSLFDAVQRLPRGAFEPLRFALLDDFDEVKPDQRLAWWQTATVTLGGRRVQKPVWERLEKGRIRRTVWATEGARAVTLHGYVHTGPGIVPVVYWVDEAGRLLFVVAGIEAYVYEPLEAEG